MRYFKTVWLVLIGGMALATLAEESKRPSHQTSTLSEEDWQMIQAGKALLEKAQQESVVELNPLNSPEMDTSFNAAPAYELTAEDQALIQQGQQLKKPLEALETADKALIESAISQKQTPLPAIDAQLMQRRVEIAEAALSAPPTENKRLSAPSLYLADQPQLLLFASRSLSQSGLQELLESAAHTPNTTVVLRGIPQGMTLGEGLFWIQKLAARQQPMPYIVLDPLLFQRYQVTSVPTVIALPPTAATHGFHPPLARVQGIHDANWLRLQLAAGKRGDLGLQGPVREIKEPDLIGVMQTRLSQIDWQQKKQAALARFWQQPHFYTLSAAPKKRQRVLDPTVVVTETIQTADGQVIAPKGARINPLSLRPFTQTVVVFDPLVPKQQPLIQQALLKIQPVAGHRVMYIATQFDREAGWAGYEALTEQLQAPVFLLTPDVLERFELQHTPSIITAQGKQFVIEELADAS